MVRSMRSWALATGMIEPERDTGRITRHCPTALGTLLFGEDGLDPFMEDPATVWLLHWSLASNRRLATWFWIFNELRETEFERSRLVSDLLQSSRRSAGREIAEDTVERDVDCFLRTYVPSPPDKRLSREELLDCPLTELGLIRRSGAQNTFTFLRGSHESLPNAVLMYCLLEYWERHHKSHSSLRFEQIAYEPGSPGQVFKLSENALVERLYVLDSLTKGAFRFDETSGSRQVFRTREFDRLKLLHHQYDIKKKEVKRAKR